MRPTDSTYGLRFLLSFGALPLLACAEGNDDDGAASSPTSVGTNPTSDSASDASDDGTGTATDPTAGTATDPTAGTATDPTAGTATDPTADDGETDPTTPTTDPTDPTTADSGTGGELPPACIDIPITPGCQAQSDKFAECYPRYARYYADYAIYCACNVSYYALEFGAGCGPAQDDLYACIGALTCEQLGGDDPYCEAESAAIDEACDFGSTSSGGIDDSADGG
jgi:hypothetical protein